ncbi:MAG: hypothetical protein LBU72_01615 [Burkholderiaceae bacterium]|nr:hypothetical protein [Burkholderiaceae bacterium]
MQSIDAVRSVLTGGYRAVDRASVNDAMPDGSTGPGTPLTILEKAWNGYWYIGKPASQMRGTQLIQSWWGDYAVQYTVSPSLIGNLTPFGNWINGKWSRNWTTQTGGFYTFIKGMGNRMEISPVDSTLWYPLDLPTLWDPSNSAASASYLDLINVGADNTVLSYPNQTKPPATWQFGTQPPNNWYHCSESSNPYPCYTVYVRVSVCDASTGLDGQSLLEPNCVAYSSPSLHYKPEGLVQKYASQLRYSVFSYPWNWLNTNTTMLRAPMRFVGPTMPDPSPTVPSTVNPVKEWDPNTGVMYVNPDSALGVVTPSIASLTNQTSPNSWPTKTPSYNLYYPTDGGHQSGFMNFINKYGEYYGYTLDEGYKIYDNIDDLYYAALRYYRNQDNPWSAASFTAYEFNTFPYVKTWTGMDPVLKTPSDPILYRCQKNFILGLSDDHTWNGGGNINDIPNLDGNYVYAGASGGLRTWTQRVGNMEGIGNPSASWPSDAGRKPSLAWPYWDGNSVMGTASSYYTAGMAYYMHTSDIRPDLPAQGKVNGKVTVDTYWVDMTEFNAIEHLSPYILAAKYGGFNVPNGYDPAAADNATPTPLPPSWWNTTGDQVATHLRGDPTAYTGGVLNGTSVTDPTEGTTVACGGTSTTSCWVTISNGRYPRPDNFFTGSDSAKMTASFQKAFANMVSSIKDYSTAFSLPSSSLSPNDSSSSDNSNTSNSYAAQYSSSDWTGTIIGGTFTLIAGDPAAGTPATGSLKQLWNTDGALATQLLTQPATTATDPVTGETDTVPAYYGWKTDRRVFTWNGSQGVPFLWDSLSAAQQSALYPLSYVGKSITGADYVNYLRGDRTNEVNANIAGGANVLRQRNLLLGDIVGSSLVVVAPPQMAFAEKTNPGYQQFTTEHHNRTIVVYAGANDGMLHAFNGSLTPPTLTPGSAVTGGGAEMFAYVPSALFNQATDTTTGTSPNNALAWLGNPNYVHHFSVDATPVTMDVDFDRTGNTPGGTDAPDWHTILVGGLGKGGKSFYALDVTDPDSMAASESNAASKVLWEFTAPDMGYSYGMPVIVKTAQYGWVVALTSGYDADGKGHLYLINPKTGSLLKEMTTPSGYVSNGLTQASAFINDYTDYTADALYAGDLNGQLWRFDLTAANATQPVLLARLTDINGAPQPATTMPLIEVDPATNRRFVLVGTGQLLNAVDIQSTQMQDFYAIADGDADAGAFSTPTTPIGRKDLTGLTMDNLTGASTPSITQGWYLDLDESNTNYIPPGTTTTATQSASGERVVTQQAVSAYGGVVAFATDLMTPDRCLPTVSNVYAIHFGMGKAAFANGITYLPQTSHTTNTRIVVTLDGRMELMVGGVDGSATPYDLDISGSGKVRLLNWRNVPVSGN